MQSPVHNRTLISVNPKDPLRWQQRTVGMAPFIDSQGSGWGNDYGGLLMLGDVERVQLDENWTPQQNRLVQALTNHGFDLTGIPGEQLKAISLALSGQHGNQVSIVGLDPGLVTAMQEIQDQFPEMVNGLHLYQIEQDQQHAYHFLDGDGVLEPTAFTDSGDAIPPAPHVGDVTGEEIAEGERAIRESWNTFKGIEVAPEKPVKKKKQGFLSKFTKNKNKVKEKGEKKPKKVKTKKLDEDKLKQVKDEAEEFDKRRAVVPGEVDNRITKKPSNNDIDIN